MLNYNVVLRNVSTILFNAEFNDKTCLISKMCVYVNVEKCFFFAIFLAMKREERQRNLKSLDDECHTIANKFKL